MNLILFNYESNENSQVFGFGIDWINEIAKYVQKLYVISLRCGEYKVGNNIEIFCINQDRKNKIETISSIWKALYKIQKKEKIINGYFIHMAHYFVPFIYPFAKYYNQKIVLWYAHKSVPLTLKIANFLTDTAVSSTPIGYQIKTDKLKILGQGINTHKFLLKKNIRDRIKNIITVGRISKIKNTKKIISAFLNLNRDDLFLYIVGDTLGKNDEEYLYRIKKMIPNTKKGNIIFTGTISHNKLSQIYEDMDLSINISDTGSLDKTILEPMAMGIPVITSNISAKKIFSHINGDGIFLLKNKKFLFEKLINLISADLKFNRDKLRNEILTNHSIERLIKKILKEFS